MNVLVIEHPVDSRAFESASQGCFTDAQVFCVDSAAKALSVMASHAIDAVILDMELLREQGFGLVAHIRSIHPLLMIIALSDSSDMATRIALYEHDADICVPKPIASAELIAMIKYRFQSSQAGLRQALATCKGRI